ncbi:hypothetical protein E8E11_005874 [Didymella keratinophila]|nr:hypothetical protein E8E11_005874 [Didymella keratinophila]
MIKNQWDDKTTKEISNSLLPPARSEIAVCIRAHQMELRHTKSQRNHSKVDGYTYMIGRNGKWTSTGDFYVRAGEAAGLSNEGIASQFFPNTRTAATVRSRQIVLTKDRLPASDNSNASTSATTTTQMLPISQVDQSPQLGCPVTEVYEQMMILHTNLAADDRDSILELIRSLDWPVSTQEGGADETGSLDGPPFAWTDVHDQLLVALHDPYGLTWEEIADAFFVYRFEKELEMRYDMLLQGRDPDNSIELVGDTHTV